MQKRLDVIIAVTGEEWDAKKEAFTESIEQRKEAIADKLHFEELKAGVERRLDTIKESILKKPTEYSQDTKEEVLDLRAEYKLHTQNHDRLGNLKALGRRIRNNPTMNSVKYKEALEEFKKRLEEKRKNK